MPINCFTTNLILSNLSIPYCYTTNIILSNLSIPWVDHVNISSAYYHKSFTEPIICIWNCTKMSWRCEYCFKWILIRNGAYTKHLCHCSQQQAPPNHTDNNDSIPLNPLLSLHYDEAHLIDNKYYLDGFANPNFDESNDTNESPSNDDTSNQSNRFDCSTAYPSDSTAYRHFSSRANQANR